MDPVITTKASRAPATLQAGNDHPVVQLPFIALIDGRQFRGHGLSLVAAYVAGLMDPAVLGATRIVRLMFQFDGFAVTLVVDAKVQETAHGSGEAELIFTQPSGAHLPQLRHILNAYIAGDLVALGQTIGVAGTTAPKAPQQTRSARTRLSLRRVVGGMGLALLSLALVAIAGSLVYQRAFVTLVPSLGSVVSTGETLRATTTGQVVFVNLDAGQGDVVVAIQAASGEVQSLLMPCDCTAVTQGLREGSTVLIGETIMQLVSASDQWVVAATLDPQMLFALAGADRILLTYPDGQTSDATADPQPLFQGAAQTIILRPITPLTEGQAGAPVQLRLLRDASGLAVWAENIRDRFLVTFEGA
ncbi:MULTISPECIES: hypothetical protein [unclassified Yoonia]|uniref:hypothetical protein n=1 Tax=unclassified Yoonia TaxID=2629118 RepID=UPI002AFDD89B|nr:MULTISPECIES: hypothetical protein [unclassified Yoonia]